MITIFDIGARFGIHPSIEPIKEISKIILVEPEIIEFSSALPNMSERRSQI